MRRCEHSVEITFGMLGASWMRQYKNHSDCRAAISPERFPTMEKAHAAGFPFLGLWQRGERKRRIRSRSQGNRGLTFTHVPRASPRRPFTLDDLAHALARAIGDVTEVKGTEPR